jgi:hypothetical protein
MSKSGITIHIGLHKTGTTFLQNSLFKSIPSTYVVRGFDSHRHLMKMDLEDELIISDEGLSGRLWYRNYLAEFYKNMKIIKKIYGDPKIIFGIRDQNSFIPSVYKQYLHEEGFENFNYLFDVDANNGLIKHEEFLLIPKINYLKENFTDVFIYSQESLIKRQNDFINSLKEFLEIKQKIEISEKNFNNIGIKTELQVRLLKRLNRLNFRLKKIHPKLSLYSIVFRKLKITPRNICQNRLKNIGSKKFEIPNSSKDFIQQYYKSDWSEAYKEISY